ncbi:hypothetical protein MYX07_02500 [Patescibacteria group bacterium AH-259-L07]|nr:hypothetical protein [Patescibacteria group bacterium AH-259-L07]
MFRHFKCSQCGKKSKSGGDCCGKPMEKVCSCCGYSCCRCLVEGIKWTTFVLAVLATILAWVASAKGAPLWEGKFFGGGETHLFHDALIFYALAIFFSHFRKRRCHCKK